MRSIKIEKNVIKDRSMSVSRYFTDVAKEKMVSSDEETELAFLSRHGDLAAREKLVKSNLRFVISVAKQYDGITDMSLSDIISNGNYGLMKAAESFDETKGFKFISYGVWWIRQSIISSFQAAGSMIRIPSNKLADWRKIKDAISLLENSLEREPSTEEIVDHLIESGWFGFKNTSNEGFKRNPEKEKNKLTSLVVAAMTNQKHISLSAPLSSESEEMSLLDVLEDKDVESPDESFANEYNKRIVQKALTFLPERDASIMDMLYGLTTKYEMELEEVANKVGMSRERIRQIREKSLKTIRIKLKRK